MVQIPLSWFSVRTTVVLHLHKWILDHISSARKHPGREWAGSLWRHRHISTCGYTQLQRKRLTAHGCLKLRFYLFSISLLGNISNIFLENGKTSWPMPTHHVQNCLRGSSLTQATHPRCCWPWCESCKNSDQGSVVCQGLVPRQSSALTQLVCLDFLQLYYRIRFCHWPVILIVAEKNDNTFKMSFTLKLLYSYFFIFSIHQLPNPHIPKNISTHTHAYVCIHMHRHVLVSHTYKNTRTNAFHTFKQRYHLNTKLRIRHFNLTKKTEIKIISRLC